MDGQGVLTAPRAMLGTESNSHEPLLVQVGAEAHDACAVTATIPLE